MSTINDLPPLTGDDLAIFENPRGTVFNLSDCDLVVQHAYKTNLGTSGSLQITRESEISALQSMAYPSVDAICSSSSRIELGKEGDLTTLRGSLFHKLKSSNEY